jgi:Zn-dependent peptidase ImmA (M78 family)
MTKRNRQIQIIVEKLLEQMQIVEPPINVVEIAKQLNIKIREDELGDISGLIYREGNQVTIGINSGDPSVRQRFTIAHELGHFFLHSENQLFVDKVFAVKLRDHVSSEAIDKEEIEANAFAAEMLMPSKLVRSDFQLSNSSILDYERGEVLDEIIKELATNYKVSKQAMTIRLINLGVIPDLD